jgi:bifunctional non-homologous end joining protein LigD
VGDDGLPSFLLLCKRMLQGRAGIPITFMIFDLLERHGRSTMHHPYWQRRRFLDGLDLNGSSWRTSEAFDDGEALFESGNEAKLEGIVAKKLTQPYKSGERCGSKRRTDYWRFGIELEEARRRWRSADSRFGTP